MRWKRAENLRLHTKLLLNNFFRIFYRIYMDNFGESVIISMKLHDNSHYEREEIDMAVIHLSKDNFNEEVLESKVPVMVDFWATWCGPCKTMTPIVEEIAEERTDIKVCKIDVDQEPELARQYRVMSIPTFLVFKDGEVVKRDMGVMSKDELEGLIV